MINESDIIRMLLSGTEMRYIYKMARSAEIGGSSSVRDGAEREEFLSEDQIIGQIGTFAGHKYMFGNANDYRTTRWYANKYPTHGDTGSDVTGANIDFKTSLIRGMKPPLAYNMLVRPRERHERWVYYQFLVESYSEKSATVLLLGWASTEMLPSKVADGGIFNGAYVLPVTLLNPLPALEWWSD